MREPVAIVGLGCRFAGASDPEALWRLLCDGLDVVREVPPGRWDAASFFDPDLVRPASANTRWGSFLDDVFDFDPAFFGVSPGEAAAMDPQQRVLLEVAWEALERAGHDPRRWAGRRVGVFVGEGGNDYEAARFRDLAEINAYTVSGNTICMIANRISYTFDWIGPSLAVDTGCSASLVAVHLACESLRRGESELALAGGVSLSFTPRLTIGLSQAWMTSACGQSRSFDRAADGYVRGEGAGLVVLRGLAEAQAAGDPILALIRATAVNHGGRGKSLTAPRQAAQEALLREALAEAALEPSDLDYVEAHGVGTPIADRTELCALSRVFAAPRASPRYVGSVKAHLGHLEWAAGIASLAKTVEAIRRGEIPAQPHFDALPEEIEGLPFEVPRAIVPWPGAGPRRAGVNSFGLGGANAHAILEAAPKAPAAEPDDRPTLVVVSARSPAAREALEARYAACFTGPAPPPLGDAARTTRVGRASFPHRAAFVVSSRDELVAALGARPEGEGRPGMRGEVGARGRVLLAAEGRAPQGSSSLGVLAALLDEARVAWGRREAWPPRVADLAWQWALVELSGRLGAAPEEIVASRGGAALALVASGALPLAAGLALLAQAEDPPALAERLAGVTLAPARLPIGDPSGEGVAPEALLTPARFLGGAAGGEGWSPAAMAEADGDRAAWEALARLWVLGADLDWAWLEPPAAPRVALPTYPFERRTFGATTPWTAEAVGETVAIGEAAGETAAVAPPAAVALAIEAASAATAAGAGEAAAERAALHATVLAEVAEILGVPTGRLDPGVGFFDLGMKSLQAVELRNRLQRALGGRLPGALPITLILEHATIDALSDHLLSRLRPVTAAATSARGPRAPAGPLDEPIAIVGMACRFPGAPDVASFWRLLVEGREAQGEIPRDRFDIDAFYDPDPDAAGRIVTRRGYFLDAIDLFDPEFFGISPREAPRLDPQHRLLLELAWEGLEDAGVRPDALAGARAGVFMGVLGTDFLQASVKHLAPEDIDAFFGTGTIGSAAAGRLSYHLKLRGPSVVVDTACSSSLVALHLACQSLRLGECELALAGGVNLIVSPELYLFLSRARALAPDGRCKTFDARADGYGRGEGAGLLVLKRLSDARAAGDRVLALVRGSATNHGGASAGFTVPSGEAQEALIRTALEAARVSPEAVELVEAHGTGTPLGDPIELRALGAVLASPGRVGPAWVGSVKTNVGHLEAAAGVAGVIKAVLALRHGLIPAHLHLQSPSPAIPWDELPLRVPLAATAWATAPDRRFAGVSSFGMSGINAHAVLQGVNEASPVEGPRRGVEVVALAARSPAALAALEGRVAARFEGLDPAWFRDACRTATERRAPLGCRRTVVGATPAEIAAALRAPGPSPGPAELGLLIAGELAIGAVVELAADVPRFGAALEGLARVREPGRRDLGAWLGEHAARGAAAAALPVAIALAAVLEEAGARPAAIVGVGPGRLAAAVIAGALSLDDAEALLLDSARPVAWRDPPDRLRLGDLDGARRAAAGEPVDLADLEQGRAALGGLAVVEVGARGGLLAGDGPAWPRLSRLLGAAHDAGRTIAWGVLAAGPIRPVSLPSTPFDRRRYWPAGLDAAAPAPPPMSSIVPISGAGPEELAERARRVRRRLAAGEAIGPLAAAEARRRGPFRSAVVAETAEAIGAALEAAAAGRAHPALIVAPFAPAAGRVAWVFAGHGAQHPGMTRELLATEPVYREAVEACDAALRPDAGFSVLEAMRPENGAWLERVEVAQPALFAVGFGLAALWRSWGAPPDLVIGHSMGEITAAVVAGVLRLAEGARLVARRGRLLARVSGRGAMLVVEASAEELEGLLDPAWDDVDIALLNGPRSTVLSGTPAAIGRVAAALEGAGRFHRRVATEVAFHSRQMDALVDDLFDAALELEPRKPQIEMISTVTGQPVAGPDLDARYWARNLREPVRFAAAAERALGRGRTVFLELSARQVLVSALEPLLVREGVRVGVAVPSLRKGGPMGGLARASLLYAVAILHAAGVTPRWEVLLPFPPAADADASAPHPLRGRRVEALFGDAASEWPVVVPGDRLGLRDHAPGGVPLLPAAALIELVLGAAAEQGEDRWTIHDLRLLGPVPVGEGSALRLGVAAPRDGERRFRLVSGRDAHQVLAEGGLRCATRDAVPAVPAVTFAARASEEALDGTAFYAALEERGLSYGPAYRGVRRVQRTSEGFVAEIEAAATPDGALWHPATLDACLQPAALLGAARGAWLPVRVARADVQGPLEGSLRSIIRAGAARGERVLADVVILDATSRPVALLDGLELRRLPPAAGAAEERFLGARHEELSPARAYGAPGRWVVVAAPEDPVAAALIDALRGRGGEPRRAVAPAAPSREAWTAALRQAGADEARAVVWLVPGRGVDAAAGERAQALVAGATALAQAALTLGGRRAPALWFVTEGAQPAPGRAVSDPIAAGLWGFARTLTLEHPELAPARLDLDPSAPAAARAVQIAAELTSGSDEDEVVYDGPRRFAVRLVRGVAPRDLGPRGLAEGRAVALVWESGAWVARAVAPPSPGPEEEVVEVVAAQVDGRDPAADVLVVVRRAAAPCGPLRVCWRPGAEVASRMALPRGGGVPVPEGLDQDRVVTELPAFAAAVQAVDYARWAVDGAVAVGGRGPAVEATAALLGSSGRPPAAAGPVRVAVCGPEAPDEALAGRLEEGGLWIDMGRRRAGVDGRVAQVVIDPDALAARSPEARERLAARALEAMARHPGLGLEVPPLAGIARVARAAGAAFVGVPRAARYEGAVVSEAADQEVRLRPDRAYVISGGLGGLGLRAAAWLARRGARHLVLLSRRGAREAAHLDAIAELEAAGVAVEVAAVDVSDRGAVGALVTELARAGRPVAGVLHAAGVLSDALLERQDPTRIRAVLTPKVEGVLALHEATRGQPLDWFIVYSSAASLLGSPGQTSYGAANAILDAVASFREAAGLPATSVSWGAVAEVGLAAAASARGARLGTRGIGSLPLADVDRVLERLLRTDAPHVGFAALDVRAWLQFYPRAAGSAYLRRLVADAQAGPTPPAGGLQRRVLGAAAADRPGLVEDEVRREIAEVLRTDPARIPRDAGLFALGLDSLLGLELRNRLEQALGAALPMSLLFANPSLAAVSAALLPLLAAEAGPTPPPVGSSEAAATVPDATPEAGLAEPEVSDDELLALARELLD